ncbi:MAG: DUF2339 domain-containing protein [Chlorobia bacterium]|nr:DUF2339 domain-containing protein [Fimbriimonadaceae bacterium]
MTEERIQSIESRLALLEQTVQRLVQGQTAARPAYPVAPPPIQASARMPEPRAVTKPAVTADAEYQFGAQWLPRIGASLMVLGIAYLIALAVNNGWITPPMLFGGAVALCLGFVAFGLRLRDEREDFGQVLTGIGSCGMFATFAGGHIYQNLYSGEMMVASFVLWSLANLGFAMWRKSRSFLTIGIIGGLLGSAMPISKDAYTLSLGLHTVILLVSSIVIVKHRFGPLAIGLWLASMLALAPVAIASEVDWMVRVAALEVSGLVCLATYLLGRSKPDQSTDTLISVALMGISTGAAFGIQYGLDGTAHVLLASLAIFLMAGAFWREQVAREALLWTGTLLACFLAPMGLKQIEAAFLYGVVAIAAGLASNAFRRKEALIVSAIGLSMSVVLYLADLSRLKGLSAEIEAMYLCVALVGAVSMAIGLKRDEDDPRLLLAFLIGWAATTRLSTILMAMPSDLRLASFSATIAWLIYGVALLVVGFVAKLKNYRYAALAVLISAVGKVVLIDLATSTPALRVAVLIGLGAVLVGGGYAYIRSKGLTTNPNRPA